MESTVTATGLNDQKSVEMEVEITCSDEKLRSMSLEDVASCSSSILNTPEHGALDEESDEDDGINVTIRDTHQRASDTNPKEKSSVERLALTPKRQSNKMNGAMRRRMKKLILRGLDKQEARALAIAQAKPPSIDSTKRPCNAMDLSGSSDGKPDPKRIRDSSKAGTNKIPVLQASYKSVNQRLVDARASTSGISKSQDSTRNHAKPGQLSNSDVTSRVNVGILPKNYPMVELSTQQQNLIEEATFDAVLLQRKEQLKPKFANCTYKPGYMIINCLDKPTSEWLIKLIPTLVPWKDAELLGVDEANIPRPDILVTLFPKSVKYDNNTIRALIESQNENLNTDAWRILNRSVINNMHIEWAFTVDGATMKTLIDRDMRINYKFGQISLKKSNKSSGKPKAEGARTGDLNERRSGSSGQGGCTNYVNLEGNSRGASDANGKLNSGLDNVATYQFRKDNPHPSSSTKVPTRIAQNQTGTPGMGNHYNQRDNRMPLKNTTTKNAE